MRKKIKRKIKEIGDCIDDVMNMIDEENRHEFMTKLILKLLSDRLDNHIEVLGFLEFAKNYFSAYYEADDDDTEDDEIPVDIMHSVVGHPEKKKHTKPMITIDYVG